jgi:hypothetical protein
LLEKKNSNKKFGICTNHTVARTFIENSDNLAKKADSIISPSIANGGRFPVNTIAKLDSWNILKSNDNNGSINFYDVALIELNENTLNNVKEYEIVNTGKIKGIASPKLNDIVVKNGASSLNSIGRIIQINLKIQVPYKNNIICDFENQIGIVNYIDPKIPFATKGDSGSILLTHDKDINNSRRAIGIIFSGQTLANGIDITYASPIKKIVDDFLFLKIKLIS